MFTWETVSDLQGGTEPLAQRDHRRAGGTGKSTLVEFMESCAPPRGRAPKALADDFEKYPDVYQSRMMTGCSRKDSRSPSLIARIEPASVSSGASVEMSSRLRSRTRTACGRLTRGT